ncbi:hypothetical protein A2U01_0055783, partial [Trifolium medium]|nr:hypothetical protein [Trifolium medium]
MVHANLGKSVLNLSAVVNSDVGASTKATSKFVDESLKETVPETDVMPNVDTYVAPETDSVPNTVMSMAPDTVVDQNVPDTPEREKTPEVVMTGNNSGDNTVVNSQFDESMRTVVADSEKDTS